MENNGIFYITAAEAKQAGSLDAWRNCCKNLEEARKTIRNIIRSHFDGWTLPAAALDDVIQQAGPEKTRLILAATLAHISYDGRISRENHAWAASVTLPAYMRPEAPSAAFYVLDTHPAVLDGFVSMFRKWEADSNK